MSMQKRLFLFLFLVILSYGFINGCTSITGPKITTWIDESFTVNAQSWRYYTNNLQAGDKLDVSITLLNGDYIAQIFVADESNYNLWASGQQCQVVWQTTHSTGGNYTVTIPADGKYYFVVYNDALITTIEVSANVKITR